MPHSAGDSAQVRAIIEQTAEVQAQATNRAIEALGDRLTAVMIQPSSRPAPEVKVASEPWHKQPFVIWGVAALMALVSIVFNDLRDRPEADLAELKQTIASLDSTVRELQISMRGFQDWRQRFEAAGTRFSREDFERETAGLRGLLQEHDTALNERGAWMSEQEAVDTAQDRRLEALERR